MRPGGASANSTPTPAASPTTFVAACSILGYAFVPRIRDLPSKRLYVFEHSGVSKRLRPLVDMIDRNWAAILRVAARRTGSAVAVNDPVDGLALRLEHVVEAGLDQFAVAVEELAYMSTAWSSVSRHA